ncbi:MAG: superoxide dismutase [Lachnospiraceae bacterium]|nr:superoxide dismutase [Lachnospiraceae bacterium]
MFEQVKLDYAFADLEPCIDTLTMETHYGKHHATYTANLNAAAEKAGVADKPIEEVLSSLDSIADPAVRTAVRNNGGGFYNHNLYFANFSPNAAKAAEGKLAAQIDKQFGSLENLKEELTKKAVGQFGSGWAWLSANASGELKVSNSLNQDNPLMDGEGYIPLLALDVWEHAYYLKYKNLRAEYIKAYFEVLDWKKVSERYESLG